MDIPQYPLSEPLTIDHKPIFDEAFRRDPPVISELTFTNLYSWRVSHRFSVTQYEGFLIVCSDASDMRKFLKPLGQGDHKTVMTAILRDSKGMFTGIPEDIQKLFDDDASFTVEFDRDDSDYLFKIADLVSLKGSKYDGKRNLIKNFKSRYAYTYMPLSDDCATKCLEFEERWCVIKNCDSVEGLKQERLAIKEMAAHFKDFNLIGGAIVIEGKICAVAIAETLNPQTLVMHVLKADPNIPGLYQTIHNEFLTHIASPHTYVNFEQDLGIEGLRKAKSSYHPCEIIKKYTITLT
ncbi:MAG: phosphatidylglycerol lysyltransferase domain-containing protein [Candidatus Omnitrophica bacterium]|nr:phosphatidylglycerol lysyltransferase domain-containing protein [Candidatus Omnitrophota bacterium]